MGQIKTATKTKQGKVLRFCADHGRNFKKVQTESILSKADDLLASRLGLSLSNDAFLGAKDLSGTAFGHFMFTYKN